MYEADWCARMRDTFTVMTQMNRIIDDVPDESVRQMFYVQRDRFLEALKAKRDSSAEERELKDMYESLA